MLSSSNGLQQLPYRAQELVSRLPFAAGANLLVGAKITRLFEISLNTGIILSEISGTDGTCPPSATSTNTNTNSQENINDILSTATVWIGRTDFIVRAFDTQQRSGLWNVTYSEITLPSSSFYDTSTTGSTTNNNNDNNIPSSSSSFIRTENNENNKENSTSSSSIPIYNEYIQLITTLTQRYTLQTTMHGDIIAADTNTGEFLWQASNLEAPISNIFVMGINKEGKTIQTSVPFSEFWPQENAPVWKKSSVIPSIGPTIVEETNTNNMDSQNTNNKDTALLPKSQVFIGILSNGQLYASPKTHYSIDIPKDWLLKMNEKIVYSIASTGEILYLPAPEGEIHPEGISNQIVSTNSNEEYIHDIVEQEFIDHCTTLFHTNKENPPPSCLIGLHNVSFIMDNTIAKSHSNLLPALPLYLSLPDNNNNKPSSSSSNNNANNGPDNSISITEVNDTDIDIVKKLMIFIFSLLNYYYSISVIITSSIIHALYSTNTEPPLLIIDSIFITLIVLTVIVVGYCIIYIRRYSRQYFRKAIPIETNPLLSNTSETTSNSTDNTTSIVSNTTTTDIRKIINGINYRFVGRLGISDKLLGYGSHGTMVYEGLWDSRPVAVKRLLRVLHPAAKREVSLLIKSDGHANVVRYFTFEEAEDFLYLALELCENSLAVALENCLNSRLKALNKLQQQQQSNNKKNNLSTINGKSLPSPPGKKTSTINSSNAYSILDDSNDNKKSKKKKKGNQDMNTEPTEQTNPILHSSTDSMITFPVPIPTPATRAFLREIVSGIAHLHNHRIVHRDIKPHNILLARKLRTNPDEENKLISINSVGYIDSEYHNLGIYYTPKISDFGLGKQLDLESSSFGHTFTNNISSLSNKEGNNVPLLGSSLGFHPRLQHSSLYNTDHNSSQASGAVAPGSVGWQAPEIIIPVLRARAQMGVLPPLKETIHEDDEQRELSSKTVYNDPHNPSSNSNPILSPTPADTENTIQFRQSRAADIWSLGCLIYTVLDPGGHPFGAPYEREANIVKGTPPNLSRISHLPLAVDLISSLVSRDPRARPTAEEALEHPFFWTDEEALNFLCDISDKLEAESTDNITNNNEDNNKDKDNTLDGVLTTALEQWGIVHNFLGETSNNPENPSIMGWVKRFPNNFMVDSGRHRRYNNDSISDCLRLLRNKRNHFHEIPLPLRQNIFTNLGSENPRILYPFFSTRIPKLLSVCYTFALRHLAHEHSFAVRLGPLTTQRYGPSSLLEVQKLTQQRIQYIATLTANNQTQAMNKHSTSSSASSSQSTTNTISTLPLSRSWYNPIDTWYDNSKMISNRTLQTSGGQWVKATIDQDGSTNIGSSYHALPDHTLVSYDSSTKNTIVLVLSAYDRVVESRYQGGAHVYDNRYKSRICKDWDIEYGKGCPRGIRCDFAHGMIELRIKGDIPLPWILTKENKS